MFLNEILKIDYVVAEFKYVCSLLITKTQRSYLYVFKERVACKILIVSRICMLIFCLK